MAPQTRAPLARNIKRLGRSRDPQGLAQPGPNNLKAPLTQRGIFFAMMPARRHKAPKGPQNKPRRTAVSQARAYCPIQQLTTLSAMILRKALLPRNLITARCVPTRRAWAVAMRHPCHRPIPLIAGDFISAFLARPLMGREKGRRCASLRGGERSTLDRPIGSDA